MKYIALAGKIGSGKSTVGDFLWERGYINIAIASNLKRIISDTYGILPIYLERQELKSQPMDELGGWTPREVMTFIGTECFRKVKPTVWIDKTCRDIRKIKNDSPIVVTDVRYPHEWLALKEIEFVLVYVERPTKPPTLKERLISFIRMKRVHSSEKHHSYLRSQANYIINNDSDLTNLKQQVMELVRSNESECN